MLKSIRWYRQPILLGITARAEPTKGRAVMFVWPSWRADLPADDVAVIDGLADEGTGARADDGA